MAAPPPDLHGVVADGSPAEVRVLRAVDRGAVDGAGPWRRFRSVTLPLLSPITFFNLIRALIASLQTFTQGFVMSGGTGGPADSTLFYNLYLYLRGFTQFDMGYASAVAWVLFVLIAVLTAVNFLAVRHWVFYEDWALDPAPRAVRGGRVHDVPAALDALQLRQTRRHRLHPARTLARRRLFFTLMLGTMMLPGHVLLVPQYVVFAKLGWLNTYYPLLVPNFLATNAFYIFLMVQFMRALPTELDDAARIDGCGPFRTFWKVIMPLSLPAFATNAIFTFISVWNEFFGSLLYLTDSELYTVPLALRQFVDSEGQSQWGQMFAMSFVSLAPVVDFFIAGQKYLVKGIATTGLK